MSTILKGREWWAAMTGERRPWLRGRGARQLSIALVTWLAVSAIFTGTLLSQRIDVQVGDLAPRSVYAPYGVIDWGATQRRREQAIADVAPVYSSDRSVYTDAQRKLVDRFSLIASLAADTAAPLAERESVAEQDIDIGLPNVNWGQVLTLSPSQLETLEQDSSVILSGVMGPGANSIHNTTKGLDQARTYAAIYAGEEEPDPGLRLFLTDLVQSLIQANTFINHADTLARQQLVASQIPLVKILKGAEVLTQGQRVTENDIRVLNELGLLERGFDPAPYAGSLLLSAVLVASLGAYLWFQRRHLLQEDSQVVLTGAILVLALGGGALLDGYAAVTYLVVPTAAIMVAVLYDSGLGIVLAGVLALASTVVTGVGTTVALVSFLGAVAGVLGVKRLSHRFDIFWAGLAVGIVNLATLLGMDLMQGASLGQFLVWQGLVFGLVDGLLSAALAGGFLQLVEGPLGLVTAMKLIELSNPNQPLLRNLLVKAPGTYHHSIMVGNLAEAATEAVGGNSLLARVGAYYHDIGKSKADRAYFFVDNQFGGENPHDKLSPTLSAIIISSHVRDGVELAKSHHLPDAIVQFIQEHHGTTLMRFFYQKAVELDTGDGVVEEDFRYEGPRPQSKETAIVMLADASEATCRTLKNPTPPVIEQTVRRLIKERLEDGQLDESDLTLRDLDTVAKTFTRVLTGVFHQRVEYPERVLREIEKKSKRPDPSDPRPLH
jgi:putative nucleotidyltransferase with HDIG domain